MLLSLSLQFTKEINLVVTVPAIKTFSAITIISEIGTDMSVFPTAKHICSWAGLTPQNNESAEKKKSILRFVIAIYLLKNVEVINVLL